ncbi:MAG: hypothetical protein AMJ91_01935 [candidate division Zixibacteria bacterium SM23_73_3]|nr:MAG: hypothetical protein AMJ91_01935 [candidate division Zixibacteria bacterium SM23_73_3]
MTVKVSNRTKGLIFALLIGVLFFAFSPLARAEADPTWISLTPGMEKTLGVNLLQSDFDQVVFEILIPGIWSEEIATKGGNFTLLSISQGGASSVIGEPNLPVITKMVQIPFGAKVDLSLESFQVVEKSLEEWGIDQRIAPVQPSVPKIEGAWEQAEFVIHEDYYQQNAFLPVERIKLGEIGIIRGHRFVNVSIYPVSYNPQAGRVRIYSDIKIKVTLSGSDMTTTQNQLYRYASPPFEELCQDLFINYETYAPIVKDAPQLPIGYLIITHQSLYSSLADLVDWKTQKGFHVTVAQVPGIGSTKEAIKGYIEDAYDNWNIPPTYVLFVGDTDSIPTWIGSYSSTATDLYYAKMDPDYFADIFRGRLPARNQSEADAMVNKILYYESPTSTDLDWMGNACFIASDDAGLMAERTHRYVIQNYLAPAGMEADTIWDRTGGYTYDITNCVEAGKSMVCYSGHGYNYGWACVPFNQNDVRSLNNPDQYPFVLSHACVTGTFNLSECFGETWAKQINKAAIAFWGSSANTMWDEDDILEKRMFQAAFVETCYAIGDMTDRALYYVYQYYGGGGYARYYLDCYNIMGDPSIDLWTTAAESLYVDFPSPVNTGTNTVTVTVQKAGGAPVYGALVCLYKGGEVFETGYADLMGQVTLYPSPTSLGYIDVTVTAYNFLPFVGLMEVGSKIGDVTNDGQIDITDVLFLVNYLYKGGPAPDPLEMGDVNCDELIDAGDVLFLINYLYKGGASPCS